MNRVYAGIDLHSNNNVVVVTDDEDKILYRKRRRNELDEVLGALSPFARDLAGAPGSRTNWPAPVTTCCVTGRTST